MFVVIYQTIQNTSEGIKSNHVFAGVGVNRTVSVCELMHEQLAFVRCSRAVVNS